MNKKIMLVVSGLLVIIFGCICYRNISSNASVKNVYADNDKLQSVLYDLTTNYHVTSIPISQLSAMDNDNLPTSLDYKGLKKISDDIKSTPKAISFHIKDKFKKLSNSEQVDCVRIHATIPVGNSTNIVESGTIEVNGTGYCTINPFGWGGVSGYASVKDIVLKDSKYLLGLPSTITNSSIIGKTLELNSDITIPVKFRVGSKIYNYNVKYAVNVSRAVE